MKIPVYDKNEFQKELSVLQEDITYDFEVTNAIDKVSKNGNQMEVVEMMPLVKGIKFPITEYFVNIDIQQNRYAHFLQIQKMKDFLSCLKLPYEENAMERIKGKKGKFTLEHKTNSNTGKQFWGVKEFITSSNVLGNISSNSTATNQYVNASVSKSSNNIADNSDNFFSQSENNSDANSVDDDIPF